MYSTSDLQHLLLKSWPSWFGLILSFDTIMVSWSNHHAFFKYVDKSSTLFIYTNGVFLLTIVTLPFSTELMAEYIDTPFAKTAILVFCFNGLVHSLAWLALFQSAIGRYPLYKNEASHKKLKEGIRQTFYGFLAYRHMPACILVPGRSTLPCHRILAGMGNRRSGL